LAAHRKLSLTAELVAKVHRVEQDCGADASKPVMTDDEYEAAAEDYCRQLGDGPLWVFAYGSLIWRPEFAHIDEVTCTAYGWRRSFCLDISRWRASPGQPGLMMALDRGGSCRGVAYRLAAEDSKGQILRLLRRETTYTEGLLSVRWITVTSQTQKIKALTFWARPHGDRYINLPIEQQAHRLARACGHFGTGAEYLYNTVSKLEELGIHDKYLWQLQALVAREIIMDANNQSC
jgi:glutathione-specific gamma-glutamylcyclotransferase